MQLIIRCKFNFNRFDNPMYHNKYIEGSNKFKGADLVINKVAFLQSENPTKKYTVHHEDAFLGLIETAIPLFIEEAECPHHRIKLFKCDGEIIWDRKHKFTLI